MKTPRLLGLLLALNGLCACGGPQDGLHTLTVISTSDGNGRWLDDPDPRRAARPSLLNVGTLVREIREREGPDRVLLLDAGGNLSGAVAPFCCSRAGRTAPHLYPLLAAYLGYDALIPGVADWETGHAVYDRVAAGLRAGGCAVLCANAVDARSGRPCFPPYRIFRKSGLKVAVLGFTNSATAALVDREAVAGLRFLRLGDGGAQREVDRLLAREKPDVVIVALHSGTGKGDGTLPEKEALDLLLSLRGVDLIVGARDHRSRVIPQDGRVLVVQDAYCKSVGESRIEVTVRDGKVVEKKVSAVTRGLQHVPKDSLMRARFSAAADAIRDFAERKIGELTKPLHSASAYSGSGTYMDLYHRLALDNGADISLQGPLAVHGTLPAGAVSYLDMAALYPFENKLMLLKMSGREIKAYLEAAYDAWLAAPGGPHVLALKTARDFKTGGVRYDFAASPANFDSAGGLVYTVDLTRSRGERVRPVSMADGREFSESAVYTVGLTSYRAAGAGHLLKAAGIGPADIEARLVRRGPLFRDLLYDWIAAHRTVCTETVSLPEVTGSWKFIPEDRAEKGIGGDLKLIFGK